MAEKQVKEEKTPEPVKSKPKEKTGGIIHGIIVVLLALLVVALVSLGVFYFAIKNNVNGLANVFKPYIENHPIFKLALPAEFLPEDPDDPKYLSEKALLKKYEEYRTRTKELEESLKAANKTIEDLKVSAENTSQSAIVLSENQAVLDSIKQEQAKLDEEKKKFSELIASADKEGFKNYYQKVDKATADAIYKEVVTEEVLSENKLLQAKPFSLMEPESAAKVLTELYAKDKETLLDIFEGLKPSAAALILEKMDAKTAADVTKLLSDRTDR